MKQPTHQKIIDYSKIVALENDLHKLESWTHSLLTIEDYFHPNPPRKKELLAQHYYAQGKIFAAFLTDFQKIIAKTNKEIAEFKRAQVLNKTK